MLELEPEPAEEPHSIGVDLDAYLPLFDDPNISDDEKRALLGALWSIVMSFVQLGWGVHPIGHARASRKLRDLRCGQIAIISGAPHARRSLMVESTDHFLIGKFDGAAIHSPQRASDS